MLVRLGFMLTLTLMMVNLAAQSARDEEPVLSGGPFIAGGGIFNFDRDTRDLALEMGGVLDARLRRQLGLIFSAGFVANVANNDAFVDRSGLYTAGLRYSVSPRRTAPFLTGGYALSSGEGKTRNLFFAGGGLRHWYGEKIGVQLELRDYLSGELNFLEGRIVVLLR